jgi:hypothetical protein
MTLCFGINAKLKNIGIGIALVGRIEPSTLKRMRVANFCGKNQMQSHGERRATQSATCRTLNMKSRKLLGLPITGFNLERVVITVIPEARSMSQRKR